MLSPAKLQASRFSSRSLEIGAVLCFCLLAGYQLFGPVPIGLANNGDFPKVLGLFHVPGPPPEASFRYFVPDLKVDHNFFYTAGLPTSEILVAAPARLICRWLLPHHHFDLRVMGAIHCTIMALALWLMVRALRSVELSLRIACVSFLLFIWTDVEYVQFFSTAYIDAGAMVFFCLMAAIALNVILDDASRTRNWAILFSLSGVLVITSKLQHVLLTGLLLLLTLRIAFSIRQRKVRRLWLIAPLSFILAAAFITTASNPLYRADLVFDLIFNRLAPGATSPSAVLSEFGLDPVLLKYVGDHAFMPDVPMNDREMRLYMIRTVTTKKVMRYYLRHPDEAIRYLKLDWMQSAPDVNLSHSAGRFREADIALKKQNESFTLWSTFRSKLVSQIPTAIPLLFVLDLIACLVCALTPLGSIVSAWPILAFTVSSAIVSYVVATLNESVEVARHITLFQFATDLSLFTTMVMVAQCLTFIAEKRSVQGDEATKILLPDSGNESI